MCWSFLFQLDISLSDMVHFCGMVFTFNECSGTAWITALRFIPQIYSDSKSIYTTFALFFQSYSLTMFIAFNENFNLKLQFNTLRPGKQHCRFHSLFSKILSLSCAHIILTYSCPIANSSGIKIKDLITVICRFYLLLCDTD